MCRNFVLTLMALTSERLMALIRVSREHRMMRQCPSQPGWSPQKLTDDTNLSAKEAYGAIRDALATPGSGSALDLGAGAGYSTKVLHELGYTTHIDAVDPSGDAWRLCEYASGFDTVSFHEQTDEAFLQAHSNMTYDAINIAYGIATTKAEGIGAAHLKSGGRMLAPVEDGYCMAVYEKTSAEGLHKLSEECGWGWQQNVTKF
eukprot:gnl/MRDRNA2_/MRDRNA2_110028_c0_seq1.p1 gnl/MRDRNA2_/MRDRNA2_110028_c0~~gnl/MRDRNA2_/MRDRNA2_110028_c0_seq1.p1  ORF type:complete len:203 (+),score=41.52 gnl/MRDRNA2_/MRDRNA2_110028_c0_seq1:128-736(+)